MTLFNPSLRVTDLTVFRGKFTVYSEKFHTGLNIISGENSSGKSSIMDFLFFGLGGDLAEQQWRETSLLCDSVILGVECSGHKVSLLREVEPKKMRPMEIFFGDHVAALKAPRSAWQKFPYSRGGGGSDKESFSQVLFRLLGLPEVRIDEQNVKITMHQLLRLLYSDQLTSVERIFRQQQPDDAITRSTVADILLGAYSDRFYSATLRLKEVEDELKDVQNDIRSARKRNLTDGQPLTEEWLNAQIKRITSEIDEVSKNINEVEGRMFSEQFDDRLTLNDQKATQDKVIGLQVEIGRLSEDLDAIEMEISEARDFIQSMEKKVADLKNAGAVINEFEYLNFDMCPACMGLVEAHQVEGGCSLCKESFNSEDVIDRSAKMLNEAIRQRDRSISIQKDRTQQRNDLLGKIAQKKLLWEDASRHYSLSLRSPTSELRAKLRELNRKSGYKHRELEELSAKRSLLEELKILERSREALQKERDKLTAQIDSERKRNLDRKAHARDLIENLTLDFLHKDLDRQSTFKHANSVSFDFEGDRLSVNGESFFSASSMVYLRNSFLAAFHFAAARDPGFGHPRLLLMDTVEDKGMEVERSKHFQNLLAEKATATNSEHQIIIATSMISEKLNNPRYVVGQHYTHENRSLMIQTE
ncbi:MAG: AAA family ATPase [Alteromonadaceae bacterium]|nr:AAA family ATPase [Alteromonadaceae bacterium]